MQDQTINQALDRIQQDYVDNPQTKAHTVYEGTKKINGVDTGIPCIVVVVPEKEPITALSAEEIIPSSVYVQSTKEIVCVDVVENPQFTIQRLQFSHDDKLDCNAQAQNEWQRCHNSPVPGGAQIAPQGAGWVGTLGCAFGFVWNGKRYHGALTNWHVAHGGQFGQGHPILQPHGSSDPNKWIAKQIGWGEIKFGQNDNNLIDASFLEAYRSDGLYAPGTQTVKPEQLQLGRIVPNPIAAAQVKVGDIVVKSGRTTFATRGRIVGINGTSFVGYGPGQTARFVKQFIIEGIDKLFSNSGDSGSLILTEDLRPLGLLFAGGGNQTIANPIEWVTASCNGFFF